MVATQGSMFGAPAMSIYNAHAEENHHSSWLAIWARVAMMAAKLGLTCVAMGDVMVASLATTGLFCFSCFSRSSLAFLTLHSAVECNVQAM